MIRVLYVFLILISASAQAQNSLLQCGPMLGYSEKNEVLIWVQTKSTVKIKYKYWEKDQPYNYYFTKEDSTVRENGFTLKEVADHLIPGKLYSYELYINGELFPINYPLQFKAKPLSEPDTFRVALGSCALNSYDDNVNEIFSSIYAKRPDVMLWLGDNVYFGKSECDSKESMLNCYTQSMSRRQIQPLFGSVHNYGIWDDHDFGPDNSDSTFCNKEISREVFKLFWGNPSFGINDIGVTTALSFPDADFFLMDNRYMRSPNGEMKSHKSYLGESQLNWLLDSLKKSKAKFKIITIGNQVLPWGFIPGEAYGKYRRERRYLLKEIKKENIEGVFFISGDRHFSELSRKKRRGNYPLYDLTVSPLTSTPISNEFNINFRRVKGTFAGVRNFAVLEFCSDLNKGRKMNIYLYNSKGNVLWQKSISWKMITPKGE